MEKWLDRFIVSVGCAGESLFMVSRMIGKDSNIEFFLSALSSLTYAVYAVLVLTRGVK